MSLFLSHRFVTACPDDDALRPRHRIALFSLVSQYLCKSSPWLICEYTALSGNSHAVFYHWRSHKVQVVSFLVLRFVSNFEKYRELIIILEK